MTDFEWIKVDNLDALIIDNEFYDKQILELNEQKRVIIENYLFNTCCIGQEYYEHLTNEKDLKLMIISQLLHLFNNLKNEQGV